MARIDLTRFVPTYLPTGKRDMYGSPLHKRDKAKRFTERNTGQVFSYRDAIKMSTGESPEDIAARNKKYLEVAEQRGIIAKRGRTKKGKAQYEETSSGDFISHREAVAIAQRDAPHAIYDYQSPYTDAESARYHHLLESYGRIQGKEPELAYDARFSTLEKLLHDYHQEMLTPAESRERYKAIARYMYNMGYREDQDYEDAYY